jgi:hypothetical protein
MPDDKSIGPGEKRGYIPPPKPTPPPKTPPGPQVGYIPPKQPPPKPVTPKT